jgi:hypothetical protein
MMDLIAFPQQFGMMDINPSLVVIPVPPPPAEPGERLLENGGYRLLESGGYRELEG